MAAIDYNSHLGRHQQEDKDGASTTLLKKNKTLGCRSSFGEEDIPIYTGAYKASFLRKGGIKRAYQDKLCRKTQNQPYVVNNLHQLVLLLV